MANIGQAVPATEPNPCRYVVCFEKGQGKFGTEAAAEVPLVLSRLEAVLLWA